MCFIASSLPQKKKLSAFFPIISRQSLAKPSKGISREAETMVGMFKSFILLVCSTVLYVQPETNQMAGIPKHASSLNVFRPDLVITRQASL